MLVEIVFETQGRVDQCKFIDDSSLKYREREDHIAQFINEKLVLEPNNPEAKLTKVEVSSEFKIWYENTYGRGGPNIKEVHEYLDKKIGRFKTAVSAWTGARINYNKNKPDIEFDIDDDDVY
jgi:phage/plasmid-associated DNA primase